MMLRPSLWLSIAALAAPAFGQEPVAGGIAVNQLGYLPDGSKVAVLETDAAVPVAWTLAAPDGRVVARGRSLPQPIDPTAGKATQRIDFGGFRGEGDGFRLHAGGATSAPFAIRRTLYRPLARDAAAFFYHQRAGVPIEARFVGQKWARPAGHPDERATCFSKVDPDGRQWPACGYTLDVTGGWYDAGDHGKYVVNGGISLWTLAAAVERLRRQGAAPFADGALHIPEAGNGRDDLLDETRVEMAFLLSMQVPDGAHVAVPVRVAGQKLPRIETIDAGGMAHLKVGDENWTPVPTPPHLDRERRWLYPPSTSATLNLAATAAQCARMWRGIDDAFAGRCLSAARRAWDAAVKHPAIFVGNFTGSGGYGDDGLEDERWWAAAELFATTGEDRYHAALKASPHWQAPVPGEPGWPAVAPLGTITLATVPNRLPPAEHARMRAAIVAAADRFLADGDRAGYRIPFAPPGWSWGSTSNLLNRAMILGYAADLTGDVRYRTGVIDAADYVLGRNPVGTSYVTGYGTVAMRNPHHRFWAPSRDPNLPPPPAGVLSGGPNSTNMSDPVAMRLKGKCAPQRCWADDIDAYALNEVAINWNAPLVWVATYLAEPPRPGVGGAAVPVSGR